MQAISFPRWSKIGFIAGMLICLSLQAAENVFTGAVDNRWFNDNNWTLGTPRASHDVVINDGAVVLVTNGQAYAKTVALNGNSTLRFGKKIELLLASPATAMHLGTGATIDFIIDDDAYPQVIKLRAGATCILDGIIIGSHYSIIQSAEEGLANIVLNGTLNETVDSVVFEQCIITGAPTILGNRGLVSVKGEIRLNNATDIPYIAASGYIGGTFSIRAGGQISSMRNGLGNTIDLAGITGGDRMVLNTDSPHHILNGLDGAGNLADGREWVVLAGARVDFNSASVNGILNGTSVEIQDGGSVSGLRPTTIDSTSTLRILRSSFSGGGITLQNDGVFEMPEGGSLSNITIESHSPFSFFGNLSNVTFRMPVIFTQKIQGTNIRCEEAVTILEDYYADLTALGPLDNQASIYMQRSEKVEILGGYTASVNSVIYAEAPNGYLKFALDNGVLGGGGEIRATEGVIEFLGSPLTTITNNTTYTRGPNANFIGEQISQIDAGSVLNLPYEDSIIDLKGSTLVNDGEIRLNKGTIANGTLARIGNLNEASYLRLTDLTVNESISFDHTLIISNVIIKGDVTMLNSNRLAGTGTIQGHLSTYALDVGTGILKILGDLTLRGNVDTSSFGELHIARDQPGSPFNYGGNWRIRKGRSLHLIDESETTIPLDGNTSFLYYDAIFPANFNFNEIRVGCSVELDSDDLMDLNNTSLLIAGTLITRAGLTNGTIDGSGSVTVPRMRNMIVNMEAEIRNRNYDTFIDDCTFNNFVSLKNDSGDHAQVTNSTFNGPIQVDGGLDAVGGIVNILGNITPIRGAYAASNTGHLRIDLGDTNGHLLERFVLAPYTGGIVEVLGETITVIDADAQLLMSGGEGRNIRIREVQPNGRLAMRADTMDLAGEIFLNDGKLQIGNDTILQNGIIAGVGMFHVEESNSNGDDALVQNLSVQQPCRLLNTRFRLSDSTLEQGITMYPKALLRGFGIVKGAVLSDGAISADVSGQILQLAGSIGPTRSGLSSILSAVNGGILQLDLEPFGDVSILIEDASLVLDRPLTIDPKKTLVGRGNIAGDLTNGNMISIGDDLGTLELTGNYVQENGGTLALKVGGTGPGEFDQFVVVGDAQLDGVLDLQAINGYRGAFQDELLVMKWTTHSGRFSRIKLPPVGFPKKMGRWVAEYRADGLYVRAVQRLKTAEAIG